MLNKTCLNSKIIEGSIARTLFSPNLKEGLKQKFPFICEGRTKSMHFSENFIQIGHVLLEMSGKEVTPFATQSAVVVILLDRQLPDNRSLH